MKYRFLLFVWIITVLGCTETPTSQQMKTSAPPVVTVSQPAMMTDSIVPLTDYLRGRFDPTTHPDFVQIDPVYADREGMYLHQDTYAAFKRMHAAATNDGVTLTIRSATRNFDHQKRIWENKWTGRQKVEDGTNLAKTITNPQARALKILLYSSMPGTSRHHWGTDIDLNSFDNDYFRQGTGKAVYDWLTIHAANYGFCQPYTTKGPDRPHGYEEERWHWSYLPLARPLTDAASTHLQDQLIDGFLGADVAPDIKVVARYVLGINPDCKSLQ